VTRQSANEFTFNHSFQQLSFPFCSGADVQALSAASINVKSRRIPQPKGALLGKEPYPQLDGMVKQPPIWDTQIRSDG